MKKKIIIVIIAILLFCAPLPRKDNVKNLNVEDSNYTLMVALSTAIMPFRKRDSIITRLPVVQDVFEEIKPILHIKYKNVVSRVKFRPQSARMVVDDLQNFFLKNANICSIFRTWDFA